MSSVIVLDSSDEDEAPTKKPRVARFIPATITPINRTATPNYNANSSRTPNKTRALPSGITVTRQSPVLTSTTSVTIAKPAVAALQKVASSKERLTPSPSEPLASSGGSVVGPLIATVQSMTASTTPPLQLLATPPPQTSSTSFSDQLMFNTHLLPESTSITLSPTQKLPQQQPHPPHNNNHTTFKIQLPLKRANSKSVVSPIPSPQQPALPSNTSLLAAGDKAIRRIKPTTLLRNSDAAWLQRQSNHSTLGVTSISHAQSTVRTPEATNHSLSSSTSNNSVSYLNKVSNASSSNIKFKGRPGALDTTESVEESASVVIIDEESPKSGVTPLKNDTWASKSPKESASVIVIDEESSKSVVTPLKNDNSANSAPSPIKLNGSAGKAANRAPLEPEYEELLRVCRQADPTPDMERLIESKLLRYYYDVHEEFVRSRGFRKNVRAVSERIHSSPDLVYYNLKTIVDELKARRGKGKLLEDSNTEGGVVEDAASSSSNSASAAVPTTVSTGSKRMDKAIKKLNRALHILNMRIEKLEETEVDWEDDDSTYVQVERFKKRACQIYEKICDLTGENKNAHRLGKRPIQFTGTVLPQFNRTLQGYINRTREFPDFFDVLRMLEHCNREYNLGLVNFEIKRIAQEAFWKVGKLLQTRRRNDLYETVTHFTANSKDPAAVDPELNAKLAENQKKRTNISDIINKYASLTAEEQREARLKEEAALKSTQANQATTSGKAAVTAEGNAVELGEEEDDDDEDDEEEDECNTLEDDVEKLTNGNGGELMEDLSDVESVPEFSIVQKEMLLFSSNSAKATTTTTPASADVVKAKDCDSTCKAIKNNNNIIMRSKTGDAKAPSAVSPLNGRLKELLTTAANQEVATAPSALKAVTVASLQENLNEQPGSAKNILSPSPKVRVHTATTTASSPTPASTTAESPTANTTKTVRQRTVAEIVISDEES